MLCHHNLAFPNFCNAVEDHQSYSGIVDESNNVLQIYPEMYKFTTSVFIHCVTYIDEAEYVRM